MLVCVLLFKIAALCLLLFEQVNKDILTVFVLWLNSKHEFSWD